MRDALLVGVGGFIGAIARHLMGGWLLPFSGALRFPVGTLAVNVLGCALIGVFAAFAEQLPGLNGPARLVLVTGVLGGFTTFSAFGLETALMLRRGDSLLAAGYVVASVLLGLAAVWLGMKAIAIAR
ncbi:fluoride efflux transporter CrcB [Cognatilysobacter lacus]|uniref:Fluoride-specific ion channel FluC n=1 Tax=Cognatilysobacter lacus TaxID=1643323 RepID=A0A5D8Z847_9GAMM|nr:fluoride efflux transporter CrcB [Lysobacter lacus]TZF90302.1 fluoride efflux transporter CrcB [Lysobacter lacus]